MEIRYRGYFAAWYSFSGLRADDRMLNNVILRELYLNTRVYPIMYTKRTSSRVDGLLAVGVCDNLLSSDKRHFRSRLLYASDPFRSS